MKICIINFLDLKYPGGNTVSCKILAKSLKKRGYDVFVITTGPKGSKSVSEEIQYGIKVYRFYPFGTWIPQYTRKVSNVGRIFTFLSNFWNPHTYLVVKKILKKENPDIVNIHEVPYLSLSVYSAAKSLNLPIVSTIHSVILLYPFNNLPYLDKIAGIKYPFIKDNYKIYEIISKIYEKINKIIINSPDCVTFVSKAIMGVYSQYTFFKHSKKTVFPNIFEIDEIELKKENTNKKIFNIIYAGGLAKIKGGHTLIKAFRKINNENIRLHIFGSGEYAEYFKKLAEGDKRIIFHGQLPNEELQKFYEISDIAVMPSQCLETFGRIIIESFCVGVPVIGSNVGAIPELIHEGYNGFLFEPGNAEQLKEILEYAILNQDKLKKMRENCINTAKKYSVENNIYKLEEIYKEAIKLNQRR
ncbi:putative Glycosyltransferase [groundwater metagenome]|uniref:Putative Glycosyltransferase n=1 Tax=groundwater metagenome TaxID=717931 RepID=A0A098EBJ7_9ZZZZ